MTELTRYVKELIRAEGPLSVAAFMEIALLHPLHGYYIKGDPLGVAGDFTTAPEISQMFGELMGLWIVEVWRKLGAPNPFVLLELGPGRGTLMADALRATAKVPGFHAAMKLFLIESNETLREQQLDRLASYHPTYMGSMEELPDLPLFTIANEYLDALPVHQYVRTGSGWRERMVGLDEKGNLAFVSASHDALLPLPDLLTFYELSPLAISTVRAITAHIVKFKGASLWIDYGYYVPDGANTLQAVSGHKPVPPLSLVGHVDLTAHVDFAALRLAAEKEGGIVAPLALQGEFLERLGIQLRAEQLRLRAAPIQCEAIDLALQRLTSPEQMGNLFKVMAVTSAEVHDLPGFL
ncbi:MAG: class I SAM-dependent methyltransferase [Proteobacteria bacterium]|nr:class I SAM-dependent methyltransferase [Pseudomonadota bacterium]